MRIDVASGLVLIWLAGSAHGAVQMDDTAGRWRDSFTDLSGLAANRQGTRFAPTGYTIASSLQTWTQPSSTLSLFEAFSSPAMQCSPTVVIGDLGSSGEYLTLWHRQFDPADKMQVAFECVDGSQWGTATNSYVNADKCSSDPNPICFLQPWTGGPRTCVHLNGVAETNAITGAYGLKGELLEIVPGAGWDVKSGYNKDGEVTAILQCMQELAPLGGKLKSGSIGSFYREPLLFGGAETQLQAGYGYSASFLVSAKLNGAPTINPHLQHSTTPYLMFQFYETMTKTAFLTTTLYESDFVKATVTAPVKFSDMTPVTLHLPSVPAIAGASWDLEVYSQTKTWQEGGHPHCTIIGPVWLTADKGTCMSPVFDTLSERTRWENIGWNLDQTEGYFSVGVEKPEPYFDSLKSVIPEGSPLTPVKLSYRIGNDPSSLPLINTVKHGGEEIVGVIGLDMVNPVTPFDPIDLTKKRERLLKSTKILDGSGASVTGRYFQYSVTLYSRSTAQELDSDLKPRSIPFYKDFTYFGGYRPRVEKIQVEYYACAARATSQRIAPASLKRWLRVNYATDPSPLPADQSAGTMVVDVLAPDGTVLLADVQSGASLATLAPFQYPALVLRAALDSDSTCTRRPVLKAWEVTWEPSADPLILDCNSIRPHLGEQCGMIVMPQKPGRVKVEVHDAAGQSVKILLDADLPAEARLVTWDGRNEHGDLAAPGVYFVVVLVPGGKQVRRLAVLR